MEREWTVSKPRKNRRELTFGTVPGPRQSLFQNFRPKAKDELLVANENN
jgi:hypothetical protein